MEPLIQNKALIYGLLVAVGVLGALGDIAVNQWAKTHRFEWWLASCTIWIGAATLFGTLLRWQYFTFGIAVVLALLVHSGIVLIWDAAWERAKLSSLQWVGVILAISAFCFIELGRQQKSDTIPKPRARQLN